MELFLGTENGFSALKTRRTGFGRQPYHNQNFSDWFWAASSHKYSNIQQREDGSTMRYAKAPLREIFAISLGAARSSLHRSISATRETRHVASRWRAVSVCVDLVHQQLSPRRRLPPSLLVLDETNCGCSTTSQLRGESGKALLVDTITTTRSHRLVVKPEARGGG